MSGARSPWGRSRRPRRDIWAEHSAVENPLLCADNFGHLGAQHSVRGVCCCPVGRVAIGGSSRRWGAPAPKHRCQSARPGVGVKQRRQRWDVRATWDLRQTIEALLDTSTTGRATNRSEIGRFEGTSAVAAAPRRGECSPASRKLSAVISPLQSSLELVLNGHPRSRRRCSS